MASLKHSVLSILLSTLWISMSEFLRNTFLLHNYWIEHYKKIGIPFPEDSINGAIWGIWSFCFAIIIFILSRKFSLTETTMLSWFIGFILMWLVIGNLSVLPLGILPIAIPLSLLEAFIASLIIKKFSQSGVMVNK